MILTKNVNSSNASCLPVGCHRTFDAADPLKDRQMSLLFWFPDQEMYIFLGHCLLFVILRKAVFLMLEKI